MGVDSVAAEKVKRSVKCTLERLNLVGKYADRYVVTSKNFFEVVRKFVTRAVRHYWLLDIDKESFDFFGTS